MMREPSFVKSRLPLLVAGMLTAVSGCGLMNPRGDTYYVRPGGSDQGSGLSMDRAWATVARVNAADLDPGDRVLFEGGSVFPGTLALDSADSGTRRGRVLLSSFGGKPAVIYGGDGAGLSAEGCHDLALRNLAFRGSGRKTGNAAEGVFLVRCDRAEIDSFDIRGFQHSGLRLHACDDARITNVFAHDNGFAGIHVTGNTMGDSIRYDNHRLYIGHCVADDNPGDPTVTDNHSGNGILASSVEGGTIEYCEASGNGWDMPRKGNGPVGIWIWDAKDVVIQHCVSHDNRTSPGSADGGGFDFDGGVSHSVLQYCLSHGNWGPGIGLFEFGAAKPWHENIVRYNISVNDGKNGQGSLAVWKGEAGGSIRDCDIYNNAFFNGNPNGPNLCFLNNWEGFRFRNNVFVYSGVFLMAGQKLGNERFENNCYWNLAGNAGFPGFPDLRAWAEKTGNEMTGGRFTGITADPGFRVRVEALPVSPLSLEGDSLSAFIPGEGSALVDAGLDLRKAYGLDPGKRDILGNTVPSGRGFDIGAVERPAPER